MRLRGKRSAWHSVGRIPSISAGNHQFHLLFTDREWVYGSFSLLSAYGLEASPDWLVRTNEGLVYSRPGAWLRWANSLKHCPARSISREGISQERRSRQKPAHRWNTHGSEGHDNQVIEVSRMFRSGLFATLAHAAGRPAVSARWHANVPLPDVLSALSHVETCWRKPRGAHDRQSSVRLARARLHRIE